MKSILLNKSHDITAFASTDPSRYVLQGVHFNAAKKRLEATNGQVLITVPVVEETAEGYRNTLGVCKNVMEHFFYARERDGFTCATEPPQFPSKP